MYILATNLCEDRLVVKRSQGQFPPALSAPTLTQGQGSWLAFMILLYGARFFSSSLSEGVILKKYPCYSQVSDLLGSGSSPYNSQNPSSWLPGIGR